MELKQLAPGVWSRPHEPERDRPMLCYIRGGRPAAARFYRHHPLAF